MNELVRQGKVRQVATSNYSGWQVVEMFWISERKGYRPPYISQPMYNLIARGIEQEYLPMCQRFGVSNFVYNPLAGWIADRKTSARGAHHGHSFRQESDVSGPVLASFGFRRGGSIARDRSEGWAVIDQPRAELAVSAYGGGGHHSWRVDDRALGAESERTSRRASGWGDIASLRSGLERAARADAQVQSLTRRRTSCVHSCLSAARRRSSHGARGRRGSAFSRHHFSERVPVVSGAADGGALHPAVVRRRAGGVDQLSAFFPDRIAGGLCLRALAGFAPKRARGNGGALRPAGGVAVVSANSSECGDVEAARRCRSIAADLVAAGGDRRRAVLAAVGHGPVAAALVHSHANRENRRGACTRCRTLARFSRCSPIRS